MKKEIIEKWLNLLDARLARLTEDGEQIKELKTRLKEELYGYEMGELVEIEDGVAYVYGYWADNQNDYGPHPNRYTEISGFFKNYRELAKYIRDGGNLGDLEAEYTQYPEDGEDVTDESALRQYIDDRDEFKAVSMKCFCSGELPDGMYFVKSEE